MSQNKQKRTNNSRIKNEIMKIRINSKSIFWALIFVFFGIQTTYSQDKTISLEDAVLRQWTTFAPKGLSALKWIPQESYMSMQENSKELFRMDEKLEKKLIVGLEDINKVLELDMKWLPNVTWQNKESFYFSYLNAYYEYNTAQKSGKLLLKFSPEAENIDFHPASQQLAFTIGNNLFMADAKDVQRQISKIETTDIVCGQSIARNEFGIGKGTFWSPKGNFLAFYQKNETEVTNYPLIDISTTPATLKSIKYPMAGQKSEFAQVGVYNPSNNRITYLRVTGDRDQYLTNLAWDPSEKYLYIAVVNRDQNQMWLNQYSAVDGQFIKTLFEEKHDKYVEPEHGPWFLPNAPNEFLWLSERNGYNHVYRYNTDGKLLNQVTTGKWVVDEILGLDASGKRVIVTGSDESGLNMYAYSAELKSGKLMRLTDAEGVHHVQLHPDGSKLIDDYSNLKTPRVIRTIATSNGKEIAKLQVSENPNRGYKLGTTEILTLKADDGTPLHARIIKPTDFDPSKKYPVLVYVYGGPHAQMVTNSWGGGAPLWMNYQAERGYIIFTLDNRGSKNRGFEFENIVHRQLGTVEIKDQMVGVDYLKSLPFVDAERMAVHGWSFGGFMTISMLLRTPDVFKVGVAGGPVTDWAFYEVMYGERYMDRPEENPEGYAASKLMNHVKNLTGDLMIIHGTIDDVVVMQHSLSLIKAFVDNGILVDFFPYPMHPHNVRGKDRVHLMNKVLTYIEDKLK